MKFVTGLAKLFGALYAFVLVSIIVLFITINAMLAFMS